MTHEKVKSEAIKKYKNAPASAPHEKSTPFIHYSEKMRVLKKGFLIFCSLLVAACSWSQRINGEYFRKKKVIGTNSASINTFSLKVREDSTFNWEISKYEWNFWGKTTSKNKISTEVMTGNFKVRNDTIILFPQDQNDTIVFCFQSPNVLGQCNEEWTKKHFHLRRKRDR